MKVKGKNFNLKHRPSAMLPSSVNGGFWTIRSKCAQSFLQIIPRFCFQAYRFFPITTSSYLSGIMTSPESVIPIPSTSAEGQGQSEFYTIPLDCNLAIELVEMPSVANEASNSARNVPPAPFLRGSSQHQDRDSFRFPPLPAMPRNVDKVINWFNRNPWIFPLSYCIVFGLILISA